MKDEDRAQLAEFISVNQAAWMRTAYVLASGDKPSAEDLLQRALEKLVGKWPLHARMDEPALYVRRILVNLHIDAGRRRLRQQKAVNLTLVARTTGVMSTPTSTTVSNSGRHSHGCRRGSAPRSCCGTSTTWTSSASRD